MKKLVASFLIIVFSLISTPAEATSYKLTIYYDLEVANLSDSSIEDLDSGDQSCSSLLMFAALTKYDPENLNPLLMGANYKVKNESARIIASGKFKSKTTRPGGQGSGTCRVEATLSLPKAKFYDVEISSKHELMSAAPMWC